MIPPPSLPRGQFVRIASDPNGGFKIVTAYLGMVVGPRCDKGKAIYPEGRSSRLTLPEAIKAFKAWEQFCALNQVKK
jgi:hypothetical protein